MKALIGSSLFRAAFLEISGYLKGDAKQATIHFQLVTENHVRDCGSMIDIDKRTIATQQMNISTLSPVSKFNSVPLRFLEECFDRLTDEFSYNI